ncbi:ubiquitin-like activating enzyme 4 [Arctopsyche grandis]|uniref:ubiquitin-like activating enzyme 4 n=1 Tax=Arctopsyche grandis TaxID=121162 RepID=UPI00406D9D5F
MTHANILKLEKEIRQLKNTLRAKEEELLTLKNEYNKSFNRDTENTNEIPRWAIERYSRQALLLELGSAKEIISKLMKGSVLIVGAGGLGCPAAIYLVGAGVGCIGIVDYDAVEITNLHRQPLHSEVKVGMSKVDSAAIALKQMNSNVKVIPYNLQLDSSNALSIISEYDVILDATDNAVTRYLINDACVLTKKPLVSAAALQLSGQFTVYNYPPRDSTSDDEQIENCPCYRCLFPTPAPPETMGSCSQNGVLGPVPGVMGCLQAIEAIKILLGKTTIAGYLLMVDASDWTFTKVKLRKRNPKCLICSKNATIKKLIDYEQFCNAQASDKDLDLKILSSNERIHPKAFNEEIYLKLSPTMMDSDIKATDTDDVLNNKLSKEIRSDRILIDVRSFGEFDMCNIPSFINYPIDRINFDSLAKVVKEKNVQEVYFICRRGNDSQIATKQLKDKLIHSYKTTTLPTVKDISGGLHEWSKTVDNNFPIY